MGKLPKGDFPFLVCCGIMTMISDICQLIVKRV